jgi:NitT/TauT family transport system substrate-binding protein
MKNSRGVDPQTTNVQRRRAEALEPVAFRKPSRRWLGWQVLLLATFAYGCSRHDTPLRIGLNAWPGYEFLYLAEVRGFYKARDVEVRLVEFNSLADARAALERGQIDGLGTTAVEVVMARESKEFAPRIVRVVDYSNGADTIVACAGVGSIEELKGKRVGVELGSLGVFVLARALEVHGMKLADVEAVSSDQLTMTEQLRTGALDAIVTYPPSSVTALNYPGTKVVFSTAEIPGEVVDVLAFQERVVRERARDVGNVLRAFDDALAFASQDPTTASAVMAAREGLTPAQFDQALHEGVKLVSGNDQERYLGERGTMFSVLEHTATVLQQTGQLPTRSGTAQAVAWPIH